MAARQRDDSGGRNRDDGDAADSLQERAAIAARAELRGERAGILGATSQLPLGPLDVPPLLQFLDARDPLIAIGAAQSDPFACHAIAGYVADVGNLKPQAETRN
jgi:HEAT repeat protein